MQGEIGADKENAPGEVKPCIDGDTVTSTQRILYDRALNAR